MDVDCEKIAQEDNYWIIFTHLLSQTYIYISEKAMATHSSALAWKIPWRKEPGGLQSMGSLRVGHN